MTLSCRSVVLEDSTQTYDSGSIRAERATVDQLPEVAALVERIYMNRLGLRIASRGMPPSEQRAVLVARRGEGIVGTMTVQSFAFEVDDACRVPLDLESSYEWSLLRAAPAMVGEVKRVAVERGYPGAQEALYRYAVRCSLLAGIRYWVALVDASPCRCPVALDRSLEAHAIRRWRPSMRLLAPLEAQTSPPAAVPEVHRLPPRIRAFASRFDAQVGGSASMHPHFPEVVVPMVTELATLAQRWGIGGLR